MTLHDISNNIGGGYSVVTYYTNHPSYHGWKLSCLKYISDGAWDSIVVKALCCESEGPGIDSEW